MAGDCPAAWSPADISVSRGSMTSAHASISPRRRRTGRRSPSVSRRVRHRNFECRTRGGGGRVRRRSFGRSCRRDRSKRSIGWGHPATYSGTVRIANTSPKMGRNRSPTHDSRRPPRSRMHASNRSAASTASAGTSRVLEPRSWRAPVISTISVVRRNQRRGGAQFVDGAERVGRAVGEHRRHGDAGQVLGARPLGLARRMQRVGEQRQHIDVGRLIGDHHRRHPAAVRVAARDDRALGQRAGQLDGLDDAGLVGRGGSGRRALRPSPPVRQVVPHREPAAAGPLVADLLQQRRFPAAAGAVRQHDDTLGLAFGFVRDARDLLEVHASSLNSADTGPWPWPNGYAARRHSVTQRFPNATASGTV